MTGVSPFLWLSKLQLKKKDVKPEILVGLELERHAQGQEHKRHEENTSFEDLSRQIPWMGEWAPAQ